MNTELAINNAKSFFEKDEVKKKFQELLGKRATSFITSVLQIVASNELLKKADPTSIYQAAAVAATLDLPLNNNLGFAYIVPYNQSFKDTSGQWQKKQVAQFQMGYKGFIQLAQRSGQCQTISASPIYEGQLIEENPLTGFVFDFKQKKTSTVIGYASYIKLINGFEKIFYMSKEQMDAHGKKFSATYKDGKGLWKDDFEGMANKTVLKLLLSKYAPLSVEMQRALVADQSIIKDSETLEVEYVDNEPVQPSLSQVSQDAEFTRIKSFIDKANTKDELEMLWDICLTDELKEEYKNRKSELK